MLFYKIRIGNEVLIINLTYNYIYLYVCKLDFLTSRVMYNVKILSLREINEARWRWSNTHNLLKIGYDNEYNYVFLLLVKYQGYIL